MFSLHPEYSTFNAPLPFTRADLLLTNMLSNLNTPNLNSCKSRDKAAASEAVSVAYKFI